MNRRVSAFTPRRLTLLAALLVCCHTSDAKPALAEAPGETTELPAFFTVGEFDTSADPAIQLKATLQRAKKENKRVILLVGGDWCPWCRAASKFVVETESVREVLQEHYLVQKVATTGDETLNHDFLEPFGYIADFPHIFILDADGKQLHSQYVYKLEKGSGYDEQAFLAFLNEWHG